MPIGLSGDTASYTRLPGRDCWPSEMWAEEGDDDQRRVSARPRGNSDIQRSEGDAGHKEEEDEGVETCQRKIHDLLDRPESSPAAQAIHSFIICVILLSTVSVIIETMPEYHGNPVFFPIEMFITALFTIEFGLRLYASESFPGFLMNGFNIIDFLAIFPGYVELLIVFLDRSPQTRAGQVEKAAGSMRTLRMIRMVRLVRVFRVMRIAKVARHSQLLAVIFSVLSKVSQSGLVVILMLMGFATVLSSSLIYLFEAELCEESGLHCTGPAAFSSIPHSFWWSISTLTTVGYGDMVPHTVAGKIIGGLTAVVGVIIIATGIALVSINFRESFVEEKARADSRRRLGNARSAGKQEERGIEELLRVYEARSAQLFRKLRAVTEEEQERQDSGMGLLPMLDMLTSHSEALSADVRVFMNCASTQGRSRPR